VLDEVMSALEHVPDGFTVHPKLAKQFEGRHKMYAEDGEVDWALGEAFAFGTLLHEGTSVRVSGEDSRRGTFSHRHAALVDYEDGTEIVPLEGAARDGARFWIYDSLLSEFAALGFEYGYSVENKDALVVWEAQFGDFMNGAQVIIDQFIVAAEDKWDQTSGLVMLLPHGYEGQGPEHSSARIERFLTLSAGDNIQVCNATTAAQMFHLLRRQVRREVRKPLVIFTPKSLLRAKTSRSPVSALVHGSFEEVLDDPGVTDPSAVRRVVFASGKVAVEVQAERDKRGAPVAIARVEQLYPWPYDRVAAVLEKYSGADEIVWLQEEPENMGAWNHIKGRLYEAHETTHQIRRVSRQESASPATGVLAIHQAEQRDLFDSALGFD
jgi:2-oxoglutarate decarboxylase